jgi:hypothetical protein
LRGSREYAGSELETHSEFGRVSNETVYVAYFKFGSVIAVSSEANGNFKSSDIVWVPSGYNGINDPANALTSARNMITSWQDSDFGTATNWDGNITDGKGDPCKYAEAGGEGWHVPTKNDIQSGGFTASATNWHTSYTLSTGIKLPPGRLINDPEYNWSISMPATGYRNTQYGEMDNSLTGGINVGLYWLNTANGSSNGDALYFNNGSLSVDGTGQNRNRGLAIRCMRLTR